MNAPAPHHLEGGAAYLRLRARLEPAERREMLLAAASALEVLRAAMTAARPPHAPGLVRHERQRFAPTQVLQLPASFEPTTCAPAAPAFEATMAATVVGGLAR